MVLFSGPLLLLPSGYYNSIFYWALHNKQQQPQCQTVLQEQKKIRNLITFDVCPAFFHGCHNILRLKGTRFTMDGDEEMPTKARLKWL